MNLRHATTLLSVFLLAGLCLLAESSIRPAPVGTMPNVAAPMLRADFWVNKLAEPDRVIMQPPAIRAFNREVVASQPDLVHDLAAYPASLTREQLVSLISDISHPLPPGPRYIGKKPATSAYFGNFDRLLNLNGLSRINQVEYGFAVRRTSLRAFPTADLAGNKPDDVEYDLFQETAVQPAEPLLVLHHSLDEQWSFVQTYNSIGWAATGDLAVCRRKDWLEFLYPERFLVVTGSHIRLSADPYSPELSELELGMGCKLPLVDPLAAPSVIDGQGSAGNYVVRLPGRDKSGQARFQLALVPISSDVSEGYLPFTRANIIRQAFKMEGERYGWGGMLNGRDCSALIMDLFSCFGLKLPRNSAEQAASAGRTVLFQGSTADRTALLRNLQPGAALHFPGHVMLYLGENHGRYYVISAMGSYTVFKGGEPSRVVQVQEVAVSDLSLQRSDGRQWLEDLTTGKLYE